MDNLKEQKNKFRKQIFDMRKELKEEETARWDHLLSQQIRKLPMLGRQQADSVYLYVSMKGEAGTKEMIEAYLSEGRSVAVPRVEKKTMHFYYIDGYEDLELSSFGILEPKSYCKKAEKPQAPVIVPGVAFSEKFQRTGYGAGFYDHFFEKEPEHEKIAICYDFQIFDELAVDEYDVLMDYIVTPSKVLRREEA